MEPEVVEAEIVLPTYLSFKRVQTYEKYPKGQSRGRHWKHLKQIIQSENYSNYPPDEPTYVSIESPLLCIPVREFVTLQALSEVMINVLQAPYYDPRTKLRYANAEVFRTVRSLPNEYVQKYLAMRNAAVVLK
ncbi:hypothetical protein K1719_012248 [Acacia pycnantha]|nr:hypothetical protein K1719_012248 [Acacia pycnantha]